MDVSIDDLPPLEVEAEPPTINSVFRLNGRRVVDLDYLLRYPKLMGRHEPFECSFLDMEPVSELRKGFKSTVTLKCSMCNMKSTLCTEDPAKSDEYMDVNTAAVSGAVSTGGGYAQLEELMSVMDIPFMAKGTWKSHHRIVAKTMNEAALESMLEAGREEARLAKAAGRVGDDGIPIIPVVADGAWAKRSYRVNFNSSSGVVSYS